MSERSGGFGAFLFGIVLGAVAGFVFAPTEGGESTRRRVTKGLRNLKELAEDKVDEVRGLLQEAETEAGGRGEGEGKAGLGKREEVRRPPRAPPPPPAPGPPPGPPPSRGGGGP